MLRYLLVALATGSILLITQSRPLTADVYLDLDGVIATPEPTGFVTSGTTITLKAIFALPHPTTSFDAVAMTMTTTGAATATHLATKAGPLSGFGGGAGTLIDPGPSVDGIGGGSVAPGTTLDLGSPSVAGFVDVAGYSDPITAANFGGMATTPFTAAPLDIMGWEFTITGPVGSSVTFTPGPGLDSGLATVGGGPEFFYDTESDTGIGPAMMSIGTTTITIIPEPNSFLFLGLVTVVASGLSRWRWMRRTRIGSGGATSSP